MKILTFALSLFATIATAETHRPIKVAVFQFKNTSQHRDDIQINDPSVYPTAVPLIGARPDGTLAFGGKITVERYAERARALIENELASIPEITVISRSEVSAIEAEYERNRSLGGKRSLTERPTRQHGPDFILFGNILDFSNSESECRSYGVFHKCDTTWAQVYIHVIKLSEDKDVFGAFKSGSFDQITTQWGREKHSDPEGQALVAAISEFRTDPAFRDALLENLEANVQPTLGNATGIEVFFNTLPAKARLDLDGFYVGETPIRRKLLPGTTYQVRLTKPGFLPWEARINPERGLTISPEMERVLVKEGGR